LEENDALAGLVHTGKQEQVKKSIVHFYRFPEQEFTLKEGNKASYNKEAIGEIYSIDMVNRTVGIKKNKKSLMSIQLMSSAWMISLILPKKSRSFALQDMPSKME
jgi:hypothetical protein